MNPQGITAGDWVMVVSPSPCCGFSQSLGLVYRVKEVYFGATHCTVCFKNHQSGSAVGTDEGDGNLLLCVKKIDPPAEGETREAYKNITVPA